jgi:hypothetical protein
MAELADAVLPLIRTRADDWRWNVADGHGVQMHAAVDRLESAVDSDDPAVVLDVTQRAIASAVKVILRADDSSGIIGDAIRRLLDLHPRVAERAKPSTRKLVDWMIKFQFGGEQDFFTIDPVAYATALADRGMVAYRKRLDQIAAGLGPEPSDDQEHAAFQNRLDDPGSYERMANDRHARFLLEWNAKRLAVFDRDAEAIIRTHAKDRRVAAWFEDTARALEEIGEIDLAIDWARRATNFDYGHQSVRAARYWCDLLTEHRPGDLLDARLMVFRRWPDSGHAAQVHSALGQDWPTYRDEVMAALRPSPRDSVLFAFDSLDDLELAWSLAHELSLDDTGLWGRLGRAYEKVDPAAVLPLYTQLVVSGLQAADARVYRDQARRLAKMRRLAATIGADAEVDALIAQLRDTHKRRPRLQQEFDRAGLPSPKPGPLTMRSEL